MPYTLITVTYGGTVSHSRGYETLRMCQEARSIALTGMTLDENEAADQHYAERCRAEKRWRKAQHDRLWRNDHPGRKPTNAEAEDIRCGVLEWQHDPLGPRSTRKMYSLGDGQTSTLSTSKSRWADDGMIYDDYVVVGGGGSAGYSANYNAGRGECAVYVRGRYVIKSPTDIKTAHCVIEQPDAPSQLVGPD